ncbi:MAG: hypothetical protein KA099_13165 [Alphaproteobacteria bacterium]|nr:hypothetical protein [Alphaproteobacteria bacterium]MBP7758064.1 hypothetical protein [Alphaproteobacteria bacterium]MBP7761503.1 hypothetical protein [Alphaproteobacteria bacterium]MBP7906260.1 hypothetical protein [Alphaproteobacteria bacterium]
MTAMHEKHPRKTSEKIEYSVYIHHPANDDRRTASWERAATTDCPETALKKAEILYLSKKYPKVEIKRKIFDRLSNRNKAETFRIFGQENTEILTEHLLFRALYIALSLFTVILIVMGLYA